MMHGWKETGKLVPHKDWPGHLQTAEKKLLLSGVKRSKYWPAAYPSGAKGRHEVTFALNLFTLEVRWYEGGREGADAWKEPYQDSTEWVSGTVDWVVEKDGKLTLIGDLKTGRWPVEAEDNKQILTYALPFWVAEGMPLKWKIKTRIEQWPKYPLSGLPEIKPWHVTGMELRLHLAALKEALTHPQARPDEETCRFCEGKSNCTAFLLSGIAYR